MSPDRFTPNELALLRASDRVVDQQEPGGVLDRLDRGRVARRRARRLHLATHLDRVANRVVRDMRRARGMPS